MSENKKMSEFDHQFSKISEIQKSLKFPMGGVKPIWEFFPIFSDSFYECSPNIILQKTKFQIFPTPPKCGNLQYIKDLGMGGQGSLDYIDYAIKILSIF